jgi:hypothetical protein
MEFGVKGHFIESAIGTHSMHLSYFSLVGSQCVVSMLPLVWILTEAIIESIQARPHVPSVPRSKTRECFLGLFRPQVPMG